jgi:(p)ppGpp synthase/HD superfamily hydrolase
MPAEICRLGLEIYRHYLTMGVSMIRINEIVDKIAKTNPDADLDLIERAYIYSARVHEGQNRLSGEP